MRYLSQAELNRIRFSPPEYLYTTLAIQSPEGDEAIFEFEDENDEDMDWNPETEDKPDKQQGPVQLSLVWPADDASQRLVFTGYSYSGGIYRWSLVKGQVMTVPSLDEHILPEKERRMIQVENPPDKLTFPPPEKIQRNNNKEEERQNLFDRGSMTN